MALTQKEILEIRKALDKSARPLFFFDDDPDGTCAFLQLYKYKGDGKGVILKIASELKEDFVRKVDEYSPDLVVILDVPLVSQDFIDQVSQKMIWIDHHPPVKRKKIKYYNPRLHNDNDNRPTSYWAYKIAKKDIWLGMAGSIADWHIPDFKDEFMKKHKGMFRKNIKKEDDALFETKIGLIGRIISMNLKGSVSDSMASIKTLSRIEDPNEILKGTTSKGRFILKKYENWNREYQELLSGVKVTKSKLLLYIYSDHNTAFTSELSNELLHKYPDKFLVIGRKRNGEVKMSLRSATIKVAPILKKALEGIDGHGGGHDFACGAGVKEPDFDKFIAVIKKELK
ncbi:MAG: DHHA1 domain-containing protein [archaeon]